MKYRLTLIFLISLLFASFSFNCLHYDSLIRAEKVNKVDSYMYGKFIESTYNSKIKE